MNGICAVLLSLAFAQLCKAAVFADVYASTSFGPAVTAQTLALGAINLTNSNAFASFSSVRFHGMLTVNVSGEYWFFVTAGEPFRLWVNEHFLLHDPSQPPQGDPWSWQSFATPAPPWPLTPLQAFYAISLSASTPVPIALEYIHYNGSSTTLVLSWVLASDVNNTAPSVVPPSALSAVLPPGEASRWALYQRLYEPLVPWQTSYQPSMLMFVLHPTGFALNCSLIDTSTGDVLYPTLAFARADPARVTPGPQSPAGATYRSLTIAAWQPRNCTARVETTVVSSGNRSDLLLLVSSSGPDCSHIALLAQPTTLWQAAGWIEAGPMQSQPSLVSTLPGFPAVSVYAVTNGSIVNGGASGIGLLLPLGQGAAALSTGSVYTPDAVVKGVQTAAAAVSADVQRWAPAGLDAIYESMTAMVNLNAAFSPYAPGIFVPVGRAWMTAHQMALYCWDDIFVAYLAAVLAFAQPPVQASAAAESAATTNFYADLAIANLVAVVLTSTDAGFVPNYAAGEIVSFDRSEPHIGSLATLQVYRAFDRANATSGLLWAVEKVFPRLLAWNDWLWNLRRGGGVFAEGNLDGKADLLSWGSTPAENGPPEQNTLQAARYESGQDNSPMYDGPDTTPQGPVTFNSTTGSNLMELYDVGATALFLSETEALMQLAAIVNQTDVIPQLQQRYTRVSAALNELLWDEAAGTFTNALYNGSFYRRWGPTSVLPLLSGAVNDTRAAQIALFASSPATICLNSSYPGIGGPGTVVLQQWLQQGDLFGAMHFVACATQACMAAAITAGTFSFQWPEAIVASVDAAAAAAGDKSGAFGSATVPLNLFYSSSSGNFFLSSNMSAPDASYAFVRQEGHCWPAPLPGQAAIMVPLTMWYSTLEGNYKVCATAACANDIRGFYTQQSTLCFVFDASDGVSLPCTFGASAIARGDPAWMSQDYWRGRIWGPLVQLLAWSLERYEHVPEVAAALQSLVQQGNATADMAWRLLGHVNENVNSIFGDGTAFNNGDGDPFHAFGALLGVPALLTGQSNAYG